MLNPVAVKIYISLHELGLLWYKVYLAHHSGHVLYTISWTNKQCEIIIHLLLTQCHNNIHMKSNGNTKEK